jgi:hypothetical protein
MIRQRRGNFPDNIAAFECKGQVTKADYETILVPRVEAALRTHDKLRPFYQIGSEFTDNALPARSIFSGNHKTVIS